MRYTRPVTDEGRIVAAALDVEHGDERTLRPRSLGEFPGQERIKDNLRIAVEAAKGRGEALDHLLLYGPPGLGKTTLANIVANEMGVAIRTTSRSITASIQADSTNVAWMITCHITALSDGLPGSTLILIKVFSR